MLTPRGFFFPVLKKNHLTALVGFLISALIALVIYWPGLQGGFFFDDGPSILQAEGVRLERLTPDALQLALASGDAGPSGRPVAQLSFALNHYFSGFSPFHYKLTNLVIHLATGLLALLLVLRLFAPVAQRPTVLIVASVVAALWLWHPLQLLAVLHVVQRMTSLSALFLLTAFLLHIAARQRGDATGWVQLLLAWAVMWPLAFFSKENGVIFPGLVLAWEWIIRRHYHGGLDHFARVLSVVLGLVLVAGVLYSVSAQGQWLWAGYAMRPFTLDERLLTEGRVLWFYLGLILFPRLEALGLYHDDFVLSTSLFAPWTTLPALAGLVGLLWLAWWLRARNPLAAFGILWFLLGHILESTFLPLEIAHEHRNYLPLFGVLLAGAAVLVRMFEVSGPRKTFAITLTAVAFAYFPFVTALRAHQFGTDLRRTQIEAQHHRLSAQAQHDAGSVLAADPEAASAISSVYAFARAHFELAGKLDPLNKMSWLGLIYLNCRADIPVERRWIEMLVERLRGTPFAPADRNVIYSLKELSINGALCLDRPDVEALFFAADSNPSTSAYVRAILYSWLADYRMLVVRDLPAAEAALESSLAIAPYNSSNRLKQAQLAFLQGHYDKARALLNRLPDAVLVNSERETAAMLKECLATDGSAKCVAQ